MENDRENVILLSVLVEQARSSSSVSDTIRRLRRARNITQEALGRVLGLSTGDVQKLEDNEIPVSASQLTALSKFFGVNGDAIFSDWHTLEFDNMPEVKRLQAECSILVKYVGDIQGLKLVKVALSKLVNRTDNPEDNVAS